MKKATLLTVGILVAIVAAGQTKLIPVKKNGKYMAPLAFPLTEEVEIDSTNFWRPKPSVPVPTDDTTRIDARNATYTGNWYNDFTKNTQTGAIINVGWYKNTIALSNVAGNTAAFRFKGTKVELWSERKPMDPSKTAANNHGTGVVTIRSGTTVVATAPITFIGPQQLPVMIYSSAALPLGTYTLELKVTAGYNLIDFFVVKDYTEVVGQVPPPVVDPPVVEPPPTGSIINVASTADLSAIMRTTRGATLSLAPGTYRIPFTTLDPSLNIQGAAGTTPAMVRIVGTGVSANPASQANTRATLELIGGTTPGQFIRGVTIDGGNKANGGIFVDRDNVTLDVRVENHVFFGTWISDSKNIKAKLYLKDNSWCSTNWASGELVLGGFVDNADLAIEWYTTSSARGYGLKMLWQAASGANSPNTLGNVKINLLGGELNHLSNWANGLSRNIGIELYGCRVTGVVEITGVIKNQISLHPQQSVNYIWIHDFVADTKDTYFIEAIASNVKVENGVVYNTGILGANFKDNEHVSNVWFDNVRFVSPNGSAISWGAVNLIGHQGVSNYRLTRCEVEVLRGYPLTKYYSASKTGVTVDGTNTIKYL
jgi:hypothetical protein